MAKNRSTAHLRLGLKPVPASLRFSTSKRQDPLDATAPAMAGPEYPESPSTSCTNGNSGRVAASSAAATMRSPADAAVTTTASRLPTVSTITVRFAPLIFLPPVPSRRHELGSAPGGAGFDAMRIHDGDGSGRFASPVLAVAHDERVEDPVERAVPGPFHEIVVDGAASLII